ncbi:MAG: class I SAM-dependent methyltransferase [Bacteroidetes bacterium]|nr:class I SAM-dependent methyltransferase [Bacteroidota bacterium]
MDIKEAYNSWAGQYDTNENKTRDLEAVSLRTILQNVSFTACLEIGCGTGKNTEWLLTKADSILAVDLSEEMLAKAQAKIHSDKARFIQADITKDWSFTNDIKFDLAVFSLVLEHIENLNKVFEKLSGVMAKDGYVYIGELHPFKQYSGTKARFETAGGMQVLTCYDHHLSDFINAAKANGFVLLDVHEYFDNDDKTTIPRILSLLFRKG